MKRIFSLFSLLFLSIFSLNYLNANDGKSIVLKNHFDQNNGFYNLTLSEHPFDTEKAHVTLSKRDVQNQTTWDLTFTIAAGSRMVDFHVDSQGSIYLIGHFYGGFSLEEETLGNAESKTPFVLGLDAQGNQQFFKMLPSNKSILLTDIQIDPSDQIWVGGNRSYKTAQNDISTFNFWLNLGPNGESDRIVSLNQADQLRTAVQGSVGNSGVNLENWLFSAEGPALEYWFEETPEEDERGEIELYQTEEDPPPNDPNGNGSSTPPPTGG